MFFFFFYKCFAVGNRLLSLTNHITRLLVCSLLVLTPRLRDPLLMNVVLHELRMRRRALTLYANNSWTAGRPAGRSVSQTNTYSS